MKITISVIKADVGSIGGHTQPSSQMMQAAKDAVKTAIKNNLLIDGFVLHFGDDIGLIMTHIHGNDYPAVHQFAWDTFLKVTEYADQCGCYGAGQDLLAEAPSGNVRGAGPGVAEITFEFNREEPRPAESFMIFAADKCGPGAYNLPLYLAFADPMYCAGLMLPKLIRGFRFLIIDMDHKGADSIIELNAPEDNYKIAMLLRDNERFGIKAIYSRTYDEQCVAVSTDRLHTVAGKYTGKDDPVALVRNQGIFPAPEEIISPYVKAHYVGGDARGSHNMPFMPVPINTAATGVYCIPIVSCIGFSLNRNGGFSNFYTDFFDNPAWDYVRLKAQKKAIEIRSQGWSGPAMLPYQELEYSGFKDTLQMLLKEFKIIKSKG
ncbi:MAG: fructose 1,6-bisphosphatase [Candidatus Babeliales bacterium]